jgi:hypothetical protein
MKKAIEKNHYLNHENVDVYWLAFDVCFLAPLCSYPDSCGDK